MIKSVDRKGGNMPKAAAMKYDNLVKTIPFKDYDEGGFRQGVELDKKWLGFDVHIKYGCYWTAGKIGKEPYVPHVHDFDQVMLFAGSDMDDIGDLGAEVEFWIGEGKDMEKIVFTTSSSIYVPPGVAHFPQIWRNVRRPVFTMVVMPTTGKKVIKKVSQG